MSDVNLIAAKRLNISLYQGDSTNITLTFTDVNDAPIDLTGKAFKMQVSRVHTSKVLKNFAIGTGLTIGGAGNNILTVNPLNDLERGDYVFDIQFTESGIVTTWFYGNIAIKQEVTV